MSINLPTEYRELVARKVADGSFDSEEAVVLAALELLAEKERRELEEVERLRAIAAEGLHDVRSGRYSRVSAEDIKRMARDRYLS